jgi:hypothetical protein
MERMAVLVNDAQHARQVMSALLAPGAAPAHWVMVMCPPRLPRRIGRWLTDAQRQLWRSDWASSLRAQLADVLPSVAPGARVDWVLAETPLHTLVRAQRQQLGAGLRLVDARNPQLGSSAEPLPAPAPAGESDRLARPVAVASTVSVMLALAD